MDNYDLAQQYIAALTGDANTVIDWRVIHDKIKGDIAKNLRGTLAQMWNTLNDYNENGYGVFCNINALDGCGYELANVAHVRAHVVDLDNPVTSNADYSRALASNPLPQFAVQTSVGKYHIYWRMQPYVGNEFFTTHQRKLLQLYNGDKQITDATRVMRVPGFFHQKGEPVLVTYTSLPNLAYMYSATDMQAMLSAVNVIDHTSMRSPLGTPEMQAPGLDWLQLALKHIDPNDLDRAEWLSFTAAIKQAGWSLTDEATLQGIWEQWCARYSLNDAPENLKLWNSIRDTEVGWTNIKRRTPVEAYKLFGYKNAPIDAPVLATTVPNIADALSNISTNTEILDAAQCAAYFKNCYFIVSEKKIFSHTGRFMDSTQFNGLYGGKQFVFTTQGKLTDQPWKAATQSSVYKIPVVDHVRFLPEKPQYHIEEDALGNAGLNIFIPARIKSQPGDIAPFLDWMKRVMPVESDRTTLFEYLAHCIKFPGYKIPWAPMLQSTEGVGKTIFSQLMNHALGDMYVYSPKANQLVASGNVFNAWMRGKLLILVNEIKIDDRRELIEILKPMITDARIEVQSKGVDQGMEDNAANWLFFSNFKDAIPINENGRRYCIFYSAIQSKADLLRNGMDDPYFTDLFYWLKHRDGYQMVTHWLQNYPIERGKIPSRAPETSSYLEAIKTSRSPMEVIIADSIGDMLPGFRGDFVSVVAVVNRCKAAGLRNANAKAVASCLEAMGYHTMGRAHRPYFQEDTNHRSELFTMVTGLMPDGYGRAQGYE